MIFIKRFFRRLNNAFRFSEMTKSNWPYESCDRCGCNLHLAYNIQDFIWEEFVATDFSKVCVNCLISTISEKNVEIYPKDFKWLSIYYPEVNMKDLLNEIKQKES